jgi:hypothetical protein
MSFGQHDAVLHKTSIRLANRNIMFIGGASTETRGFRRKDAGFW